jgi:hypothetical protein
VPKLTLRSEPAHREAFVHLGRGGETEPAQWQLVSDVLHAWGEAHAARASDLGARITYVADGPPSEGNAPLCDFVVPLAG